MSVTSPHPAAAYAPPAPPAIASPSPVVVDHRIGVPSALIVGSRQALRHRVLDALDAGHHTLAIDCTETGYIDASGLGVLVSLQKEARRRGGSLVLEGVNEDLTTLFELTGLDTVFTCVPVGAVTVRGT